MKAIQSNGRARALWLCAVAGVTLVAAQSSGFAKELSSQTERGYSPVEPLPRATLIADNVVVSPGSNPAPNTPQTVVVPQAAQPAAVAAPVVETPSRRKEVTADVSSPHNYMTTIALSALMGGVAGALVGGSIYYLGDRHNFQNVGYWAAGGVLLGTGVGLVQLMVQESRVSEATAMDRLPSDPAPTFRLALLNRRF